jgi:hypothetical protein
MSNPGHRGNPDRADTDRVFILRFWVEHESAPGAVPFWRAKVSDVVSGEEKHKNGVDEALEHIRTQMNSTPI